jgi:hypothetical protein
MKRPQERGSPRDKQEGLNLNPPEEGYELCRHKNTERMKTNNWYGYYWARQNEAGDYEIRSVPAGLGEPSASGGVFP